MIFKLKNTAARSNQGNTMMAHTNTPQSMSLPSIIFLHLMVFETGHTFPANTHTNAHLDTMCENNIPTALKAGGVKIVLYKR